MASPVFDFSHLTPEERIQLAEDLWDSLAEMPEVIPIPESHVRELDRRLAELRTDGNPGKPWREVMDSIEAKTRKRGG